MTVGEKIRKFRIDQGYTQKELAIMSGLSESAIRIVFHHQNNWKK